VRVSESWHGLGLVVLRERHFAKTAARKTPDAFPEDPQKGRREGVGMVQASSRHAAPKESLRWEAEKLATCAKDQRSREMIRQNNTEVSEMPYTRSDCCLFPEMMLTGVVHFLLINPEGNGSVPN
jgi:hypothetical protein